MLERQPDRIVVYFAVNYEPSPGFVRKLSEAFEAVYDRVRPKNWVFHQHGYIIRDFEERFLLSFDHSRIGFTSLGLKPWKDKRAEFVGAAKLVLQTLQISKLTRIGFKTTAFLDLDMSHAEICDLMFGSFFQDAKRFQTVCGEPNDALLQVHGTRRGMKTTTVINALTAKQSVDHFAAIPHLELMVEHRLFDDRLAQYRKRIGIDGLMVDNDLSQENVEIDVLQDFARDSLEESTLMTETIVNQLKSLHKKEKNDGQRR